MWRRQTIKQPTQTCNRKERWIRNQFSHYAVIAPKANPCPVVIVADMTFFKRTFGVCVFRAPHLKKNLLWKFAPSETVETYRQLRRELEQQGFKIQAVAIDGRPGISEVFRDVPVQMCQFHQTQIVTRYLTTRPKLIASQILRAITLCIPRSNYEDLKGALDAWYAQWSGFLKEKTFSLDGKHWHYTHKRLRSAYRSLARNLPWLHTCHRYPELDIPNTTNSLDGSFTHLKDMLRIHKGLRRNKKIKLIEEILSKNPH